MWNSARRLTSKTKSQVLVVDLEDRLARIDAGIVDQDVDLPEPLGRLAEGAMRALAPPDIRLDEMNLRSRQMPRDRGERFGVQIDQGEFGAGLLEACGDGEAETFGATGDDHTFPRPRTLQQLIWISCRRRQPKVLPPA